MIFLELAGLAVLAVVFGVGAWHVWKHITKKETK
jgi:hypothetical protein